MDPILTGVLGSVLSGLFVGVVMHNHRTKEETSEKLINAKIENMKSNLQGHEIRVEKSLTEMVSRIQKIEESQNATRSAVVEIKTNVENLKVEITRLADRQGEFTREIATIKTGEGFGKVVRKP